MSSIVSLPSAFVLNLFYYYSTVTLLLSWILAPFLLFVILTKSKNLKAFKWFILNHSFWCFAMENIVGIIKPVLLTPAPAGYSIGLMKSSEPFYIGIAFIAGMVVTGNCVFGVIATIGNRYLSVFPSKLPKWFNSKLVSFFGILFLFLFCIGIGILCFEAVYYNTSHETSLKYDPFFGTFHEPSLFFPPTSLALPFTTFGTGLLLFSLIFCILTTAYFIYLVKVHEKVTAAKFQRSLIISCIVQIFLTCCFLILPFTLGFGLIAFQVPHTSTITCLKYCAVSTHTVLEYLSLLYFVTPYRKFCLKEAEPLICNYTLWYSKDNLVFITIMVSRKLTDAPFLDYVCKHKRDVLYAVATILPIFVLKLMEWIISSHYYSLPTRSYVPAKDIVWFIRQFPSQNASDLKSWQNDAFKEMENEWGSVSGLLNQRDVTKLWVPLNAEDSLTLENAWRRNKECSKQITIETKCIQPSFEALMQQEKVSVMKGSYKAYLKDDFGYLSPYFWKNERERWMIMRGEWIYEVPKPPPSLYFMEIQSDSSMVSYFQPVPSIMVSSLKSYAGYLKLSHGCPTKFNDFQTDYSDLLFVIHGIGHHKGEEDIVQNGYDIRKGFVQYMKKFHPELKVPMIIPVAWRHNLTLNDHMIRETPFLKFPFGKEIGLIFNDIFYYIKGYKEVIEDSLINNLKIKYDKFLKRNPNFNGRISILAHSLGSVITFEVLHNKYKSLPFNVHNIFLIGSPLARFMASDGEEKIAELKKNQWIMNGRLFNILHSLDPVSHRLEVLFNEDYKYVEPSELYLYNEFRRHYFRQMEISENEKAEVLSFYNRINCDRNLGKNHDAFQQFESATYQYAMDFYKNGNKTLLAEVIEQFDKNFGRRIIWNNKTTTKMIEPNAKIPHRLDFDISKTEYSDLKHMEVAIERKFAGWTKELLLSHLSYWSRPEVIALMTNIIYNFDSIPSCNNTVSPYIRRYVHLSWSQWFKHFFTFKTMRWFGAFIIGYLVFCVIYAAFKKFGQLAGYSSLSIVLTALWSSWSSFSKFFYFYEVLWVSWICFYWIMQISATGMLLYYAWIKSETIRNNYLILIGSTVLPFSFGLLLWHYFSTTLLYFIILTVAAITVIWPFLTRQIIQIYACFGVIAGLWCLTDPGDIGKIAILFNAPDEYVFSIYIIVFIPAILNLLITENQANVDLIFRFIYNFVLTLLALTAIKTAYIELAALSRNYELDCRNPTEDGRCLEYVLYNTETKHAGPAKTTFSAITDFISPFLHHTVKNYFGEIKNLFHSP